MDVKLMDVKLMIVVLLGALVAAGGAEQTTVIACRLHSAALSCPDGEALFIPEVNYGRTERIQCDQMVSLVEPCRSGLHTFSYIQYRCLGKKGCTVDGVNEIIYENNCPMVDKYLNATYECLPTTQFQRRGVLSHVPIAVTFDTTQVMTSPKYPRSYPANTGQRTTYSTDGVNQSEPDSLGVSWPAVVQVKLYDVNIITHTFGDDCQDELVISGNGCRDIVSDPELLIEAAITVQHDSSSSSSSSSSCCNCLTDVGKLRESDTSLGAEWNMACSQDTSLEVDLRDDALGRSTMNVLTIQMRFAGEARPSAVRVELEDIWGDVEIGTLSSINVWTWNIRPDRPQVTKIRLQPEGSGDDVISMKLSIHACAEDNSPTSYDSIQRHVICDNQIWANRNKVMNFWGPEVTIEFTSDSRINGRGYMVTVNARPPWLEERTLPTTFIPTIVTTAIEEITTLVIEETTADFTNYLIEHPTESPAAEWTVVTSTSADTPTAVNQPTLLTFQDAERGEWQHLSVSFSGTYLITSRVYTNEINTVVTLSVNAGRYDSAHYNIAWTNGNEASAAIAGWAGLDDTLIISLAESDVITVSCQSGGLSTRVLPVGSPDTHTYSVKVAIAKIADPPILTL